MTTSPYFHSRAEAVQVARTAIWGDHRVAKCEFKDPKNCPEFFFYLNGLPQCVVTAQVNNDLVVIRFDHFGRHTVTVLPR